MAHRSSANRSFISAFFLDRHDWLVAPFDAIQGSFVRAVTSPVEVLRTLTLLGADDIMKAALKFVLLPVNDDVSFEVETGVS